MVGTEARWQRGDLPGGLLQRRDRKWDLEHERVVWAQVWVLPLDQMVVLCF